MTLNEIFRRTGEPTYHTPIAVIGELVNQQEAVDKVAPYYETENPAYMNVEYVSHVIV